jgi:hypothetical protein
MNRINTFEQVVLLLPEQTPRGLGIAQNERYLYPISACHHQSYAKGENGQAQCNGEGCRTVNSFLTTFATSTIIYDDAKGLDFFVREWTGLTDEQFKLEVFV